MPALTGAQALVSSLRAHGVDTIFGIPGAAVMQELARQCTLRSSPGAVQCPSMPLKTRGLR